MGRDSANGWEASVEGKVLPILGIVADFSSYYPPSQNTTINPPCPYPPGNCGPTVEHVSFTERNYLFGPRVGVSLGKFRPFAELLLGAGHASATATHTEPSPTTSDTSFATAVGGGFDYRLIRLIAWRVQGDFVRTTIFGTGQNTLRLSTGIVVRF